MTQKTLERWLPIVLLFLACTLSLARFAFLKADFPNHSPWMIDQSKFTDEGWWASGAVRSFLIGHWHVAGDYNPAIAVPVWPVLLSCLFHFTGVSIAAVRGLSVAFSLATVGLVYLLVKRYADNTTAALAVLLLAASPFAFAYSRLATLDTVTIFEWSLLLWLASRVKQGSYWLPASMGLVMAALLLTKTTAAALLPAVFWLLWAAVARQPRHFLRSAAIVCTVTFAILALYVGAILRSAYAADYRYFFAINSLPDVTWGLTFSYVRQLLHHGMWIDPVLYPAAMVALGLSLTWLRALWRNPLFVAALLSLAGDAVYILRRQDDIAPRYFLAMLVPVILVLVLTLKELHARNRSFAALLAAALGAAVVFDAAQVAGFLQHRQYQFYDAAQSIRTIVDRHPDPHRLLLGASGDQLALMMGIPAINDGYSSEELAKKVARDQPGWYVGWNELDQDILDSLSAFRLQKVAEFPVFDNELRNRLILYRMVPDHHTE